MNDIGDSPLLLTAPGDGAEALSGLETATGLACVWVDQDHRRDEPFELTESFRLVIDGLPEQIALVDEDWTILMVNDAWKKAADAVGLPLGAGDNYRTFCQSYADQGSEPAMIVVAGLRQISSGQRDRFRHIYSAEGVNAGHDYQVCVARLECGGRRLATVTRYEVTELLTLRREHLERGDSRLRIQQDERRRIGREIHDSTAQHIVAIHLNLMRLKRMHDDADSTAVFAEIDETIDRVQREIRTISYIFHPPELTEEGLAPALRAMARGFGARTGLRIGVHAEGDFAGACGPVESTLYRLSQEALTNIHRHAHAEEVRIRLEARRGLLHLLIMDDGIGVPAISQTSAELGVGIPGMRLRVEELGGRFTIRRHDFGTLILASVPLRPSLTRGDLATV